MSVWPNDFVAPVGSGSTSYIFGAEIVYETDSGPATGHVLLATNSHGPSSSWFDEQEGRNVAESDFEQLVNSQVVTIAGIVIPASRIYSYALVSASISWSVI